MTRLGAPILGFFSSLFLEICISFFYNWKNNCTASLIQFSLKISHYHLSEKHKTTRIFIIISLMFVYT